MATPPIDLSALIAAVEENETVDNSTVTFIEGVRDQINAAVEEALRLDDAADEGTNQAVQAAINATVARIINSSAKVSAALLANTASAPTASAPSA